MTPVSEITIMLRIHRLLDPLPLPARQRILEYFASLTAEQSANDGEPKAD